MNIFEIGESQGPVSLGRIMNHDEGKAPREEDLDDIGRMIAAFNESCPGIINLSHPHARSAKAKSLRKIIEGLIERSGSIEMARRLVFCAIFIQSTPFAPVILSPMMLDEKLGDLIVFFKRNPKIKVEAERAYVGRKHVKILWPKKVEEKPVKSWIGMMRGTKT